MDIIYEDAHIIAVNKSGEELVQQNDVMKGTLQEFLLEHLRRRDGAGAPPRLHLVNRLDRPTSGIVIFDRHRKAAGNFQTCAGDEVCPQLYCEVPNCPFPTNRIT